MRDSGQPDWRCGEVAWQFQFPDAMLDQPVRELSGGWQTRVKLAALLLHDPNLLILDEPTNFLDLRTQMLLEHFLRDFNARRAWSSRTIARSSSEPARTRWNSRAAS